MTVNVYVLPSDWNHGDQSPVGSAVSVLIPSLDDIPEGVTVIAAWDCETGTRLVFDEAAYLSIMPDDITWSGETPIRTRPTQPRQVHQWGDFPPLQF